MSGLISLPTTTLKLQLKPRRGKESTAHQTQSRLNLLLQLLFQLEGQLLLLLLLLQTSPTQPARAPHDALELHPVTEDVQEKMQS